MRKPRVRKSVGQNKRLAATMATSAISLAILTAAQNPLMAAPPQAQGTTQQGKKPSNQAAFDKYVLQGYNYCDAKVLAAFWGEASPLDAKYRLGHKMLMFGPKEGKTHIRSARAQALKKPVDEMPCWYTDEGYTYNDAVVLGKYWGNGLESKAKITRMLVEGRDADVQQALKNAKKAAKKSV